MKIMYIINIFTYVFLTVCEPHSRINGINSLYNRKSSMIDVNYVPPNNKKEHDIKGVDSRYSLDKYSNDPPSNFIENINKHRILMDLLKLKEKMIPSSSPDNFELFTRNSFEPRCEMNNQGVSFVFNGRDYPYSVNDIHTKKTILQNNIGFLNENSYNYITYSKETSPTTNVAPRNIKNGGLFDDFLQEDIIFESNDKENMINTNLSFMGDNE